MTGPGFDHPERALSPAEQRDRDTLAGPLVVLRAYLLACPVAGTRAAGEADWAPVRPARHTRAAATLGDLYPDVGELYVNPALIHQAALRQRFGYRLPDGIEQGAVTPGTLADAVTFMGGRVAATLRGADETGRRSPHRNPPGWYRLSREMVIRLHVGHFVPSLSGLPGGESRAPVSPRLAARRRTSRVSSEALRVVVTDMLRSRPATVLVGRALGEARPLASRPRGRPPAGGTWVTGQVLVALSALNEFVAAEGPRHAVPPTSLAALGAMVAAMTATYPECFVLVSHVRAPDRSGAVRGGAWGWLRCDLAALGCEQLDPEPLRRELDGYVDHQRAEYFTEPGGALRSARSAADAGHRPGTTTQER